MCNYNFLSQVLSYLMINMVLMKYLIAFYKNNFLCHLLIFYQPFNMHPHSLISNLILIYHLLQNKIKTIIKQ